jgi:hypothetical protein
MEFSMRRYTLILASVVLGSFLLFAQQPPDANYPIIQGGQQQEPNDLPGQPVARLGVMNGEVSVRRGDSTEWVAAAQNVPLMAGDALSVGPGGSVEIQLDYANFIRVGGDSEVRISQLENGRSQVQLARGLMTWRVLRDSNAQSEISTPSAAVHPLRLSAVRAEVGPDGTTRIIVRKGEAEVSNPRGTEVVREGNMMLLRGAPGDPEYQIVYAPPRDGWDTWSDQRDTYLERAQSPRYVSQDVYGTEDLDQYGRWGYDPAYGNVWTPTVADSWAPYRNGQWVWQDYYGWTWMDYAPWGWAPFHYGSWYFRTGYGWSWFPGPRYAHYWWRPGVVGFFGFGGGTTIAVGFGNVGWVPLAPFEAFHPWYGRGWYGGGYSTIASVNITHNVNVTNIYRNARVANGITAVSTQDFQRGYFRNPVNVGRGQIEQASLVRGVVPVAPTASNLRFSERPASQAAVPRSQISNQRFYSRMPAPGNTFQRTPFTQQQASVRSAFDRGSNGTSSAPVQPGSSGWQRFGEPGSNSGMTVQRNGFQPSNNTPAATTPQSRPGWDRFGAPQAQRFAQPAPAPQVQQPQQRPSYQQYRAPAYQAAPQQGPRSVQVAPPIVQQRQTPQQNYRSAPPSNSFRANPGGGGGAHPAPAPSGGHGGGGGAHGNGRR